MEWTFLLGAVLTVLGALVGVGIRRKTKFLFPYDFLSILLYVSLVVLSIGIPLVNYVADLEIWHPNIGFEGYASFILGYVFGYCVDGRMDYFIVRKKDTEIKDSAGEPWVTYTHEGRLHLAVQTNRALWNRLVRNNHIRIYSNAPFEPDWTDRMKYPLLPEFKKKLIQIEDWDWVRLNPTEEDKKKHWPPIRKAIVVDIAHGSMISTSQLCYERDAVKEANEGMAVANRELTLFVHYTKTVIPRIMTNFIADTYRKSPAMAWVDSIDCTKSKFSPKKEVFDERPKKKEVIEDEILRDSENEEESEIERNSQ